MRRPCLQTMTTQNGIQNENLRAPAKAQRPRSRNQSHATEDGSPAQSLRTLANDSVSTTWTFFCAPSSASDSGSNREPRASRCVFTGSISVSLIETAYP
jgi:hypothetical protein